MRKYLVVLSLLALLQGCAAERDPTSKPRATHLAQRQPLAEPQRHRRGSAPFASLPDKGELLAYDRHRAVLHTGAHTWHPVELSQEHALQAIASGWLMLSGPGGEPIRLQYRRHVRHSDGNWTWIGKDDRGADALLTFGTKAAFGSIPDSLGQGTLRLTMARGGAWLVSTDSGKAMEPGSSDGRMDFLVPPKMAEAAARNAAAVQQVMAAANASAARTIDLVLGYTNGFAAGLGGDSQARTRLTFLVDVTNLAFANSQLLTNNSKA